MENCERHYEREATEDWVSSGMISFKMLGEKNQSPKFYIIVISLCLSYSIVFLEGDRAGSGWKSFIFLDEAGQEIEESLRA